MAQENLDILYEDKELIVCRKAAGIPVQSARIGQKDMVSMLRNVLGAQVFVVHRLDQPVEGVLVFAKTKRAAASLSGQAADGGMKKVYQAVCCVTQNDERAEADVKPGEGSAWQQEESGPENKCPGSTSQKNEHLGNNYRAGSAFHLEDYLVKDGRTNTSSVAARGSRDAKRAGLTFRVIRVWGEQKKYLFAEIELETGRHHQIRVQMAHAGLPLYGDQKYNLRWKEFLVGEESEGQELKKKNFAERSQLALCAVSLTFTHPSSGKRMTFETEPRGEIFRFAKRAE